MIEKAWQIQPAVAIHMTERFNNPFVVNEVSRLVRSLTRDVLHIPEALRFLVGEKFNPFLQRDLKVSSMLSTTTITFTYTPVVSHYLGAYRSGARRYIL